MNPGSPLGGLLSDPQPHSSTSVCYLQVRMVTKPPVALVGAGVGVIPRVLCKVSGRRPGVWRTPCAPSQTSLKGRELRFPDGDL